MNLKTFFEHFDTLAEAPNGIQRLRELILDMAVRGKLVPQNSEDEPAEKLLIKIHHQREKLIEDKIIKKRSLEAINEADYPYEIPSSWEWRMLCEVAHDLGQKKPNNRFIYIDVSAIKNSSVSSEVSILNPEDAPSRARKIIKKGTVIYSTVRPYLLNIAVIEKDFNPEPIASTAFSVLHPYEGVEKWYLYYVLKSRYFIEYVELYQKGVAYPAISDTDLLKAPFPLPPLAEQKRIVAKVDELMALCDALEAAQQTRNTLRQKLRASALDGLMNAPNNTDLETAWAFVRDNWGLMCDRPEDVEGLRQAVLYFSVRGKLVEQFSQEGSANQLLNEIKRNRIIQNDKIRNPRNSTPIDTLKKPFEIPSQWIWCRFTEVGQLERGKSKHRPRNDPSLYINGSIPLVQTGDVARSKGVIKTCTAFYNEVGLAQSKLWKKGTLCITIAANIADSGILDFEACFPDSVVGFVPTEPISDVKYFEFFMRTLKSSLETFAPSTAQKNINLAILDELLIPLPPLAEQKRIVAKVDELMKLCDQLEASLRRQQETAQALAASALCLLGSVR